MKVTQRQNEILKFITKQQHRQGAPPTIGEIQSFFGFRSPKAVSDHLGALERKGFIRRRPHKSRGIEVQHQQQKEDQVNQSAYEVVFSPKSIAIIGASRKVGSVGHSILSNILHGGFTRVVYPVNPEAQSILGVKAYASIKEVPDQVDLAVIIVRAAIVPKVIQDCAKKGVKGLVIVSAGFKETGPEGAALEAEVKKLVQKYGMALIGPNCLGVINTDPGINLNASFSRTMPAAEPTAFISQSGALCTAILDYARGIDVGFSKFVSIGNKAGASEMDMLEMLGRDPLTNVILMYIEDFVDGRRLIEVAREITGDLEKTKPILAIKSGRTEAGAKAASSHTGSLAGSDNVYDAIFAQSGILRVDTVAELFDLAIAFGSQPLPKGNRVAIVTNAGGPGIMATDACVRYGLDMAKLSPSAVEKMRPALPPTASLKNPVDVIGDAMSDRYKAALDAVYHDPNVDAILVILTPQSMTDIEEIARIISIYGRQKQKTLVATFMGIVDVSKGVKILRDNHIPHYSFPESAAKVIGRMHEYRQWITRPRTHVRHFQVDSAKARRIVQKLIKKDIQSAPASDVEEILKIYGFPVPKSAFVKSEKEAVLAAAKIGFPVAMKIVSPDIIHKIDVKGVQLNLKNAEAVQKAYTDMLKNVKHFMPKARIHSVWIQQMAHKGKEVILGMKRDPRFGPLLMFGLGGTYVEIFKDVSFRLAPLRELGARHMLETIRTYPILKGVRGEKPVDIKKLIELLQRLSQLVCDIPEIQEIDINPLMIYEEGSGGHVVDARMIL